MLKKATSYPRLLLALAAYGATAIVASAAAIAAQSVGAPLEITTFAGAAGEHRFANGTGTAARFLAPTGIFVDNEGNLIVADSSNNLVRKITPAGVVTVFAGSPVNTDVRPNNIGSADGAAADASFHLGDINSIDPLSVTIGAHSLGVDAGGNVYLADTMNHTVRKITPAGVVSTFAGAAGSANVNDGNGGGARFNTPFGLAVDSSGNVFVADGTNNTIRKITAAGEVTTLAGTPGTFGWENGTGAAARFSNPAAIAVDSSGNLYVADKGNHAIRKVTPAGVVTTFAGMTGVSGDADGNGSNARFNQPLGIAVDRSGNVYVADSGNHAIRMITPAGTVSTIAGSKGVSGSADGTGTSARFFKPSGICVDSAGVLYISDTYNSTIRRGAFAGGAGSLVVTGVPPARVQANTGTTVNLKVVAVGNPSPTYQWNKNGTPMGGQTSATLTLSGLTLANAGSYSVTVTSGVQVFTSSATELQVYESGTTVPSVVIVTQPTDQSVDAGASASLVVEATSTRAMTYQWFRNGEAIVGATSATYTISNAQSPNAGAYTVTISDGQSTATTAAANISVRGGSGAVAPAITTQPASKSVDRGASVSFTVAASGTPSPSFQWQKNGAVLSNSATVSGATTATLTITDVSAADVGSYSVVATNSAGSAVSSAATLAINDTPPPPPPPPGGPTAWISNLSVRTTLVAGQDPLIVGVSISGGAKSVLIRGIGPTLGSYGVPNVIADPRLEIAPLGGSPTPANDNWSASLSDTFASVGAFALTAASKDAAFVQSLNGGYSIHAPATGAGTILVEAYDLNRATNSPRLTNVSARNRVGTGDDVLIEGFVIHGAGKMKLLVRAIGPKLTDFGVTSVLADPLVEVYRMVDNSSTKVATNDNWDSSLSTVFTSVGAFPLPPGSKDAAMVVELEPGSYTAVCKGATGGTGEAMVEIYEVP